MVAIKTSEASAVVRLGEGCGAGTVVTSQGIISPSVIRGLNNTTSERGSCACPDSTLAPSLPKADIIVQ